MLDGELLAAIVDGPFETPLWGGFLDGLRLRTLADYASLIFRRPEGPLNEVTHLFSGAPSPPMVQQLYHEELFRQDPLPYRQMEEGRPYALDELLKAEEPAHAAFLRDIVVPSGMARMRMMRLKEASGVEAWLTIARASEDFGEVEGELLRSLAPALRGALRSYIALERERFGAAVAGEAIKRLRFGWVALDADGRVLDADAQGARTLAASKILRKTPSGRLSVRPPELERRILAAIRDVARDPRGRPQAITLSRDPWLDMLLAPAQGRAISPTSSPAVVAYIHGDRTPSTDRCEQLAQLFGLTPSEARLALALSRGQTIAEAAAEFGLTVETARNYSKKIYSKTGARGQPDLIRFVMRSVLTMT